MAEVGLIEYGTGNLQSLSNALERAGARVRRLRAHHDLRGLTHIVLPGVGAFGFCAERLRESGWLPVLENWALADRRPFLGVCVGMQLLADTSDELGTQTGLGWLGGRVTALRPAPPRIRVPHAGWNTVSFLSDFGDYGAGAEADFYFDHSYAYDMLDEGTLGVCTHGRPFSAVVRRANILGVQFHPEKSQTAGLRFLRAFAAL